MLRRGCFFAVLLGIASLVCAKDAQLSSRSLPIDYQLSYDAVKTQGQSRRMGLVGFKVLPQWTKYFGLGVAAYAPITGETGGFYAWGVAANLKTPQWHRAYLSASGFAGGGGGHSSGFGSGSILNGDIALMYDFRYFSLGLHYSYFYFPSVHKQSKQLGLTLSLPYTLLYENPRLMGQSYQSHFLSTSKNYMALIGQAYVQKKGTKNTAGETQDGTVKLVGLDVGHYFTGHWFGHLKFAGAFSGIPNGYMDVLAGPGYSYYLSPMISLNAALDMGTGGGGAVDTGGGFLWGPELGVTAHFSPHWGMGLSSGYLDAPGGRFSAWTFSGELMYWFDSAVLVQEVNDEVKAYETVWRVRAGNETVFDAKRASDEHNDTLQLVNISVDRMITPYFYLTGQGASAYSGYHIGGLQIGMLGAGVQTSSLHALQLYGELLAGAAGGGGLDLGKGGVMQPKVGLSYYFTPYIGLQTDVGELYGLDSHFHSTTVGLNMVVSFGQLEAHSDV